MWTIYPRDKTEKPRTSNPYRAIDVDRAHAINFHDFDIADT